MRIKIINFVLVVVFLMTSCEQNNTESAAVKATYERYKTAILNDKGEDAVDCVDSRTVKYYTDILEKVKTADKTTVEQLSFLDKFQVLRIRLNAKKEEISLLDGKGLISFAIKKGMVGKDSVSDHSIGVIKIEGTFAKAQVNVKNKKTPFYLNFYKEENQWKIDITSLFTLSTMAFKKLIEDSEMTENEYMFELLENVSNKKVGKEIWIPTEKLK